MDKRFVFYWGASCGGAQKALNRLDERNVMLSYHTEKNIPWGGIERLFIDSGAFSVLNKHLDYPDPHMEYIKYLKDVSPVWYALRDYVCPPDVLDEWGRTVADHQEMSTDNYREMLDLIDDTHVPGRPVATIQGWKVRDYLEHLDDLQDHGLLTDRVGIGSLVNRPVADVHDIVVRIREELPDKYQIHGFGISDRHMITDKFVEAVDSADSACYDARSQEDAHDRGISKDWRQDALHYLLTRRRIKTLQTADNVDLDEGQAQLEGFVR